MLFSLSVGCLPLGVVCFLRDITSENTKFSFGMKITIFILIGNCFRVRHGDTFLLFSAVGLHLIQSCLGMYVLLQCLSYVSPTDLEDIDCLVSSIFTGS